jgi:hypothetical protein
VRGGGVAAVALSVAVRGVGGVARSCVEVGASREHALRAFHAMDRNGGGFVLFDEFCAFCAEMHAEQAEDQARGSSTAATPRQGWEVSLAASLSL